MSWRAVILHVGLILPILKTHQFRFEKLTLSESGGVLINQYQSPKCYHYYLWKQKADFLDVGLILCFIKTHKLIFLILYSLRPQLWTKCCFMKQKCHLQGGIAQYENAATPVSSKAIHTTHQHYQKRYLTLFQLKGLKDYQQLKFESSDFLSKQTLHF